MVEYSKVNVKLSDTQLKNLKTAVKDKRGTTLRMSFKMFAENDLPHNCYWQQDKKQNEEMHLTTKCQQT